MGAPSSESKSFKETTEVTDSKSLAHRDNLCRGGFVPAAVFTLNSEIELIF